MTDHAREARKLSAKAGAYTRRGQRNAQDAASYYQLAATIRRSAARTTQHPSMWDYSNPAELESEARSWEKIADTMLRSSFWADEHAKTYRGLAASYRSMARKETP